MLLTGSLIPILFDGKRFVPASFYSVLFTLMLYSRTVSRTRYGFKILMLFAVPCIGHIFISYVYSFFMVLNNSENFIP